MPRGIIVLITCATLLAAVWLLGAKAPNSEFFQTASDIAKATRQSPRPPAADKNTREAKAAFRKLAVSGPGQAPDFQTVESVAGALASEDLLSLIAEFRGSMHDSIEGWMRAALWAEIGRREPALGEEELRRRFPKDNKPFQPGDPFSGEAPPSEADLEAYREAWREYTAMEEEANLAAFAYFRGRIETCDPTGPDLEQLIRSFASMAESISNEGWSSRVDEVLFRKLSSNDPEMTWNLLPGRDRESPLTRHRDFFLYPSYQGFFDGLDTPEEVLRYVERLPAHWESAEVRTYHAMNFPDPEQWEYRANGISAIAANSLARFDLPAATRWAESYRYHTAEIKAGSGLTGRSDGTLEANPFPDPVRSITPPGTKPE